MLRNHRAVFIFAGLVLSSFSLVAQPAKGPITLDEFMNATDISEVKLSPDGSAAVIATVDSDWQHNRFRNDLWIWKAQTGQTAPLTRSGHARAPQWSADGRYIAFLSDLPLRNDEEKDTDNVSERVWLIAADSGESFPLYDEKLDAHAFAWSADGRQLFFSCASPLAKAAEEARKTQWKDVIRWREQERGDLLLAMPWSAAPKNPTAPAVSEDAPTLPALSRTVSASEDEIKEIAPDPKGAQIAWVTDSVSHRLEDPRHNEIYLVSTAGGKARRLTNNTALENGPQWSGDGSKLYFHVGADAGTIDPPYRDVQGRLYVLDPTSGVVKRLGADFAGSFEDYTLTSDGRVIATGLKGTEQQLYAIDAEHAVLLPGLPGTYSGVDSGLHTLGLLVKHSTLTEPTQVYLAADPAHPGQAETISNFNLLFTQRAQPDWKPYRWKADDGTMVEGILIYPPHRMGGQETAHADIDPWRSCRSERKLLWRGLVRVGDPCGCEWLAGLSSELPGIQWVWRRIHAADFTAPGLAARQGYFGRRGCPGEGWNRRS